MVGLESSFQTKRRTKPVNVRLPVREQLGASSLCASKTSSQENSRFPPRVLQGWGRAADKLLTLCNSHMRYPKYGNQMNDAFGQQARCPELLCNPESAAVAASLLSGGQQAAVAPLPPMLTVRCLPQCCCPQRLFQTACCSQLFAAMLLVSASSSIIVGIVAVTSFLRCCILRQCCCPRYIPQSAVCRNAAVLGVLVPVRHQRLDLVHLCQI